MMAPHSITQQAHNISTMQQRSQKLMQVNTSQLRTHCLSERWQVSRGPFEYNTNDSVYRAPARMQATGIKGELGKMSKIVS